MIARTSQAIVKLYVGNGSYNLNCMPIFTHEPSKAGTFGINLKSGSADCVIECNKNLSTCLSSCPCMEECPQGCVDCGHPLCACNEPETNPDFLACEDQMEEVYTQCVLSCKHDQDCYGQCNREYTINIEKCPCNSGCPNGCPCEARLFTCYV